MDGVSTCLQMIRCLEVLELKSISSCTCTAGPLSLHLWMDSIPETSETFRGELRREYCLSQKVRPCGVCIFLGAGGPGKSDRPDLGRSGCWNHTQGGHSFQVSLSECRLQRPALGNLWGRRGLAQLWLPTAQTLGETRSVSCCSLTRLHSLSRNHVSGVGLRAQ
nr:uncharacterized protein LOC112428915 isoform X3 [Macaca nemestrina]